MVNIGKSDLKLDHSIIFDTNFASYIRKYVSDDLEGNAGESINIMVHKILISNLNFDHLFYMVENIKNVPISAIRKAGGELSFWKSLNRKFRKNLVALSLFRAIDCERYKSTGEVYSKFGYLAAFRDALKFSYDFYVSADGQSVLRHFSHIQRMIVLQLIGMINIKFSCRGDGHKKIRLYFSYINSVVGAYFDRETILAHKYFFGCPGSEILDKINIGGNQKNLLRKIDNIAWDLMTPRFMEWRIVNGLEGADFFVPYFLTFDKKLRDVFRVYPVKAIIYNRDDAGCIPIPEKSTFDYFHENSLGDEIREMMSEGVREHRLSLGSSLISNVNKKIYSEYRKLRILMR